MGQQVTNQNSILLSDEALNIIVDILLGVSQNGGDYIEPATDTPKAA